MNSVQYYDTVYYDPMPFITFIPDVTECQHSYHLYWIVPEHTTVFVRDKLLCLAKGGLKMLQRFEERQTLFLSVR